VRAAARGYSLIFFDPAEQGDVEAGLLAHGEFRVLSRSSGVVILARNRAVRQPGRRRAAREASGTLQIVSQS
jgi:hypothetical protein